MGRYYLYSLFIHLVIALILLGLKYIPAPPAEKLDFIEFGYLEETGFNEQLSSLQSSFRSTDMDSPEGASTNLVPDKVDLPKVVSTIDEELILPTEEDIAYNRIDLDRETGSTEDIDLSGSDIISSGESSNEEQLYMPELDDYLSSLQNRISETGEGDDPYLLEGEILSRNIESRVIPEYPEGVIRNATVKIEFQVRPDGDVTNLIVVRKDDPVFEQVSLEALRKWRFSEINKDVIQTGYITFIFKLK